MGRFAAIAAAASAIALAGCGSTEPATGTAQGSGQIVVAALGDSITAGSPGYDPDAEQRAALGFGDNPKSEYEYWAERADPELGFRNCGIFGQRTDEIAGRLDDCAAGADALVVQGGINDIAQGYPTVEAADNLQSIVDKAQRMGLQVYLVNLLPWNNGPAGTAESIAELNRLIDRIGEDEGVPVIDFHATLADPHDPTVMPGPLTADGDHPSVDGYRRLGELVARKLRSLGD